MKQASADYRIRITVNSDTAATAAAAAAAHHTNNINRQSTSNKNSHSSNSSSSSSIEESESNESAASVTIVEIDDVQRRPSVSLHQAHHSNVDETITTHNEQHHYNEKAIDVPAEFERQAYEFQRNELSPFVRNLQSNSQVCMVSCSAFLSLFFSNKLYEYVFIDLFGAKKQQRAARKRFPPSHKKPPRKSIEQTSAQIMGNGCSRNLRRLNKSGVAPSSNGDDDDDDNASPKPNPFDEPDKIHVIANKISGNHRSNCIEIGPGESHKSNSGSGSRLQIASTSHHEMPSNPIGKTDHNNMQNTFCGSSSASNFESDAFNSSCIDTKSIIFDRIESNAAAATPARPAPYIVRSMSVDSSSDKSEEKTSDSKRFAAAATHLQRLFKSNQNLTTLASSASPSPTTTSSTGKNGAGSLSFPKLYHRFSGSVQSLFASNLQNNRKRNLSASDTNLNRINGRCSGFSQQQLIDNDYCPSVFYNRKARKSYSEKNLDKAQTFSRWKNQLWLKFSRKKTNPSARKS